MTDDVKVTTERAHFFNEKQKQIKQQIMENMLHGFFNPMQENIELIELFDIQSTLDMVFSILVMLNRELLVHFFTKLQLQNKRKDIMKNLFACIKDQVDKTIKEAMN